MRVRTTIQKWGNSLALRLTGPLRSIPHFEENMLVEIDVDEHSIQVYPVATKKPPRFKEKDLLQGLTAKTSHANEVFYPTLKELGE
ncbi:MAG: transcriptional regulator [Gammaproteobacteria bacterium]|nr:transcriptional regulator [Gammaproteobacteria bacterium]